MISSQVQHYVSGFDEVVGEDALDFGASGLRAPSVIRVGRLAVVEGEILAGAIDQIAPERLQRIKSRLAERLAGSWLQGR